VKEPHWLIYQIFTPGGTTSASSTMMQQGPMLSSASSKSDLHTSSHPRSAAQVISDYSPEWSWADVSLEISRLILKSAKAPTYKRPTLVVLPSIKILQKFALWSWYFCKWELGSNTRRVCSLWLRHTI